MANKDKHKQLEELAEEDQAYDANDMIRNRKSEEDSIDEDQKTQGGETLKSRTITPFDL